MGWVRGAIHDCIRGIHVHVPLVTFEIRTVLSDLVKTYMCLYGSPYGVVYEGRGGGPMSPFILLVFLKFSSLFFFLFYTRHMWVNPTASNHFLTIAVILIHFKSLLKFSVKSKLIVERSGGLWCLSERSICGCYTNHVAFTFTDGGRPDAVRRMSE